MSNVNAFLRDQLGSISARKMQVAPNIDEKKIANAVKSFGYAGSSSNVVGLFDNTLMSSGKDGLLFTGEQLIYRAAFGTPIAISYQSISDVQFVETPVGKDGKKLEPSVTISRHDDSSVVIKDLIDCDYHKLVELLSTLYSQFEDFKEEKQLVTIEELSDKLKIAYLKVIINMTYDGDGVVDGKEFAEILQLMTRLNLTSEARMALHSYIAIPDGLESIKSLIEIIDQEAPDGHAKALHVSLVKDLLNVYLSTSDGSIDDFQFLKKYREMFLVSDEEIELALTAIQTDHKMLKDDVTDDQLVAAMKVLSAKAAAVGTPLAAVYLSGSVVGMSASGITSGLASLGMGGILGLSGMATGIGVAVLIGVGAYVGVRKLTGANELDRSKRKELMLLEVIKQTQKAISLLLEDMNNITSELNSYITEHGVQKDQIKQLMVLMSKMTGAGAVLSEKSDQVQGSVNKIKCARFLDLNKLRILTREPSKEELYGYIHGFYEEKSFKVDKDGETIETSRWVIKPGFTSDELESLAKAFEAIGYFSSSKVMSGNVEDVAQKAKDRISGLFS